tara:strand:+ start:307 stop:852 length:546 start_codon:yes stop_codon:yes gene_type:complete
MPKCPNCFYELVLLEHRRKYKCPKCGKLFFQKDIENKEFVEWNKRERKKDKKVFNGKPQKQKRLTEFEKKQRARACFKKWYEKNKDKVYEYYKKNRNKIIQQKREYRKRLSEQRRKLDNEKRKALRWQNIEDTRVNLRIEYWKRRQKALALQIFEFNVEGLCTKQIQNVLPTIALSEQLAI